MSRADIVSVPLPTAVLWPHSTSRSPQGFGRQNNARDFPLPENHHRSRERARCWRRLQRVAASVRLPLRLGRSKARPAIRASRDHSGMCVAFFLL